jgi:2',3'-cyclic-nucleotide 2'-phosphodiesterase (5'-nucleotidase family)
LIDSLRAANKTFVHLDLGDFLNSEATVGEMKSRFIWTTMEQLGVQISVPGVRELTDWPLYQSLLSDGKVRCVMSNLTVSEGGTEKPVGLPTYVMDVNGVRVGFFALLGGNELTTVKAPEGIEFRNADVVTTAQRIVPELRKQAEIVVLVSQMSAQETEDLLRKVSGIDVALYGRNPAWRERAEKVASTIVQQTGIRGQYAGQLVLIVDPDGRIVDWGSRNVALDAKIPEDAEVSAAAKVVDTQAKEALRSATDRKASEIEGKISSEHYIGSEKCGRCHEAQFTQWLSTPHAKAFATLQNDKKQGDEKCIGCHVTGWHQPGGYSFATTEPDLRNVQCESCHNVGTQHERGGQAAKVTKETCLNCHTGEWAKGFDFATYLPKVSH